MRTLVWFRGKDLRLRDNQALAQALVCGEAITVFVADPKVVSREAQALAPHRTQYLLSAVDELSAAIAAKGGNLVVLYGSPSDVLPPFVARHAIEQVFTQRQGYPAARTQIAQLERLLSVKVRQFDGETLFAPETIRNGSGDPYRVFTPFARAARLRLDSRRPLGLPRALSRSSPDIIAEHHPLPTVEQLGGTRNAQLIQPGERAALSRLRAFIAGGVSSYESGRDDLAHDGTSRLSADLAFGTVSPRQVWFAVEEAAPAGPSRERFLTQLLWREFAYATLWDRPNLLVEPFLPKFKGFPWRERPDDWAAWANGRTGYPVVDAAARQLLSEGYVHNRARMIAASFLSKDLLVNFRAGESHYLRYLTDGDVAINDLGWQWSSGTGCDAQPYFRIFNPVTQGKNFDPQGKYVQRYLPELARLPEKFLHCPWEASEIELRAAGIRLGKDYPRPVVIHQAARSRFLALAAEFFGASNASDE